MPDVFFDELRSDRQWRYFVAILVCVIVMGVGGVIAVGAIVTNGPIITRVFVGTIFGALFVAAFGGAAAYFTRRALLPPRRVRMDTTGVTLGGETTQWEEIEKIEAIWAGGRRVWIRVHPQGQRGIILPGPPLTDDQWDELADAIAAHIKASDLPTKIG